MKQWYKSKTIIFNLLTTAAPIVGYLATSEALMQSFLTPTRFAMYSMFIGFMNAALRAITTQGISFFKENDVQ